MPIVHAEEVIFSGIRCAARTRLLPFVLNGSEFVKSLQATEKRSAIKTFYCTQVSHFTSTPFFVALFPVLFYSCGYSQYARNLMFMLTCAIYCANWWKDFLCLPRPNCEQLNHLGNEEYGLPSSHCATATALGLFTLFYALPTDDAWFPAALALCLFFMLSMAYSRLYLGMHTLADVLAGQVVAAYILLLWYFGLGRIIDGWLMRAGNSAIWTTVTLGSVLLSPLVHPQPHSECPCFEDSAILVGSSAGIIIGTARLPQQVFANFEVHTAAARFLIGFPLILAVRLVAKKLGNTYVPLLMENTPRIWTSHGSLGQCSKRHPWDCQIPVKFLTYMITGWATAEFIPLLFVSLGIA